MFFKIKKIITNYLSAWTNLLKIKKLDQLKKEIIFYAESRADWIFLDPIIESINIKRKNLNFIKITSDPNDELLNNKNVYYIGYGTPRTILFRTIKTKGFVMTLTDLETFHLKKSIHNVHYFYVFHSMVSTHRAYRENAFDAYDTILCVGKYQILEIREMEKKYKLNKKNLIEHGYGRLDNLIIESKKYKKNNKKVIIAPTWGESSLIDRHLDMLINILILNDFIVTLRLHPMTIRYKPDLPDIINKKYSKTGKFFYDFDSKNEKEIIHNDIMISEWSGAALEFAFANKRPVIFIDTKPKINNINFQKIKLPFFEDYIRKEIGEIIAENSINEIPKIINNLLNQNKKWSDKINKIRKENIFNIGKSGNIGATTILDTLNI